MDLVFADRKLVALRPRRLANLIRLVRVASEVLAGGVPEVELVGVLILRSDGLKQLDAIQQEARVLRADLDREEVEVVEVFVRRGHQENECLGRVHGSLMQGFGM